MNRAVLFLGFACSLSGPAFAADPSLSTADKAALQAAMYQYIDRQTVNGAFLNIDLKNGGIEQLAPVKAHPLILGMGENFVLCSNFRARDGRDVDVDFYVAREKRGFVIFRAEIGNRAPLMSLINDGKAKPLE